MNRDKHLPSPEVVDWLLDQQWSDVIPVTAITYPSGNPDGVTESERFDCCSATVAIGADECCHLQLPVEALEALRSDQQARRIAIDQKRAALMLDDLTRKRARDETRKGEEFPMPPDLIRRADQLEQEVEKLLRHFRSAYDLASATGWDGDRLVTARTADLLKQLSAAAPMVVPVPVSERLPEPDVKVLAHYVNDLGKGRTVCAIWVPAKTRSDSYDDHLNGFNEYDEETNEVYWPEGWYEVIENCEYLGWVKVDEGEVVYWQPLPKWPAHALPLPSGEPQP